MEDCEAALHRLAQILSRVDEDTRAKTVLDRSLTCTIRDLEIIYGGQLRNGELCDIRQVSDADAQIRLAVDSDDLLRLTDGQLSFARAWATGRVRVDASVFDLLKLRTLL